MEHSHQNLNTYTILLDTNTRTCSSSVPDPSNPTNQVALKLHSSFGNRGIPATSVWLGSAEVPLVQQTVEKEWNNLYFSEGIDLPVNSSADLPTIEFGIQEGLNGPIFTAELPPLLNPIVHVDFSNPSSPIFTTEFPHSLALSPVWASWVASGISNQPMQLIGTLLQNKTEYQFTSANTHLVILNETMFQLQNITVVPWVIPAGGSDYGYVWAPTIPNPTLLADALNAALFQVFDSQKYRLQFDPVTNQFALRALQTIPDNTRLVITGPNSLPFMMGFGSCSIPIPKLTSTCSFPQRVISSTSRALVSGCAFQCRSRAVIDPGFYNSSSLGPYLESQQFNRFYFEPGCMPNTANEYQFVFADNTGTCHSILIPFGKYTPETLASFLQTQMNAATTTDTYTVTYNPPAVVDGTLQGATFTISSNSGQVFSLEFGDADGNATNPSLASKLGFLPVSYRGRSSYTSPMPFFPLLRSCCSSPTKYLSFTWSFDYLNTTGQYVIDVQPPKPISAGGINNVNGTMTFTTTIAHGFQVGDVIYVTGPTPITSSSPVYKLKVISVVDAFHFLVDTSSASSALTNGTYEVSLAVPPFADFYFASSLGGAQACSFNLFPAKLLGLPTGTDTFVSSLPFTTPFKADFDGPSYLLLSLGIPPGSTKQEHFSPAAPIQTADSSSLSSSSTPNTTVEQDVSGNLTQVFAKMLLYPALRIERLQFTMSFACKTYLSQVLLTILNPDHTPYQLHGREWSLSLCFGVPDPNVKLLCCS